MPIENKWEIFKNTPVRTCARLSPSACEVESGSAGHHAADRRAELGVRPLTPIRSAATVIGLQPVYGTGAAAGAGVTGAAERQVEGIHRSRLARVSADAPQHTHTYTLRGRRGMGDISHAP